MTESEQATVGDMVTVPSVTPLDNFSTDTEALEISFDTTVTRASEEQLRMFSQGDVLIQHARLFEPDHLLWTRQQHPKNEIGTILGFTAERHLGYF
jgi:hypothetical protein